MSEPYELTSEQEKAVRALQRALNKCRAAGVYLWDNYGTINAVNGRVVTAVAPDHYFGETLDESQVTTLKTSGRTYHDNCWHGSNADDELFVKR